MSEYNLTRIGDFSLKKSPRTFSVALMGLPEEVLLATLPADIMLDRAFIYVAEAFVSAGAVTADLGTTPGGSDILAGVDLTTLGPQGTFGLPQFLSGANLHLTITAPSGYTGGKIIPTLIYLEYLKDIGTYTELTNTARFPNGWILDDGTWDCSANWICTNTNWRCN